MGKNARDPLTGNSSKCSCSWVWTMRSQVFCFLCVQCHNLLLSFFFFVSFLKTKLHLLVCVCMCVTRPQTINPRLMPSSCSKPNMWPLSLKGGSQELVNHPVLVQGHPVYSLQAFLRFFNDYLPDPVISIWKPPHHFALKHFLRQRVQE